MQPLKYDGQLDIATGKSRKETHWRNESLLWSELVDKLSATHRTHETVAEYHKATKTRQAEIKDVGGFVAGYVNGGRRKTENITFRSMLTLDLDFAHADFWDTFTLAYECAAVLYSTHKHTPDSPRLRLVIPLSRTVLGDEYVAIARRVAGTLGINDFDDTTFEPARLMYWPSTPADGEYVFEVQDGRWLDADEMLETYADWRNASEWPTSDRVREVISSDIKKQGDPLEKTGVIGAFCREYDIHTAITSFLTDTYIPSTDNRYTYDHGSTAGGLVVYEDKFAFSHHGTDPVSGKLVNAFDLVRIHLFGDKDENVKEGTPINKTPSFIAMEDWALKDKNVRRRIGQEKMEDAKTKFSGVLDEDLEDSTIGDTDSIPYDDSWLGELDRTKKGECLAGFENAELILRNDPKLKGLFALNEFDLREIATRDMPWRKITHATRFLTDTDDKALRSYIEKHYNFRSKAYIQDAHALICKQNAFHPIKEYLQGLVWDGTPRVDKLLIEYLGSEDTAYHRAAIRKTCVAAVARIFTPGCKFDYVLTLVGRQGLGKSTFISKLGKQWYSDSFGSFQGKEAYESIQGVWIMEMGELAGMKKAEHEAVKHFITKADDRFRVAYGHRTETFPRQVVFIGTTNNTDFLQDGTGNRRFWPIDCGKTAPVLSVWEDLSGGVIDQIWAEAFELYKTGETLYFTKEVEEMAKAAQEHHREADDLESLLDHYLDRLIPENWKELDTHGKREFLDGDTIGTKKRTKIVALDIWFELLKGAPNPSKTEMARIKNAMRQKKGWNECESLRSDSGRTGRGFQRE